MCLNPTPIRNNVFLKIDKALIDEITSESGFKLYLAPEYNYEQNVTCVGTVAGIPKQSTWNIKNGDQVAFSYAVISNRDFPNTSDFFVPLAQAESCRIWQNAKGEKLRMTAHQGAISIFWTGVFFDTKGQFVQEKSIRGTEEEVERWMHSNFKFGDCEKFTFRNLVSVGGEEYWKCSIDNIFAKKQKDNIIAVGDRVICKFIEIPLEQQLSQMNGFHIPKKDIKVRLYDRGEIVSGGAQLGLKKGQIVSFDERYVEKYSLWGTDYALIKRHRIEGLWCEN